MDFLLFMDATKGAMSDGGGVTYDFTGGALPSGASLARSSTATYLSSSTGLLDQAAIDEAVFEKGCLRVEPQRTNECLYSEMQQAWGALTGITLTQNQAVGPDGQNNMMSCDDGTSNSQHSYTSRSPQTANYEAGKPYVCSIFAKTGAGSPALAVSTASGLMINNARPTAFCDLENKQLDHINEAASIGAVQDYGNDILRCSVGFIASANKADYYAHLSFMDDDPSTDSVTYQGANNVLYVWGGQKEDGLTPTSYIPTNDASVTRAQDQLTLDIPSTATTLRLVYEDDSTQEIDVSGDAGSSHTLNPDILNSFHIKRAEVFA